MVKKFDILGEVEILLSDKSDGNMKAVGLSGSELDEALFNDTKLVSELGLQLDDVALVRVTYDRDDYLTFREVEDTRENNLVLREDVPISDGLLTSKTGVGLFLPLADCLGVVIYDRSKKVLMMVHCGRHTTLQGGAGKTVQYMKVNKGCAAADMYVWMSPSAGGKNYPLHDMGGISLIDAAMEGLLAEGVPLQNIEFSEVDTTMSSEYYSHSKGDKTDRFAICAAIKS